jgi:hypothetical protein
MLKNATRMEDGKTPQFMRFFSIYHLPFPIRPAFFSGLLEPRTLGTLWNLVEPLGTLNDRNALR